MVEMLSMCWAASSSPEIAVTVTGVSCKLSERRCAVTMITAIFPLSDAAGEGTAAVFSTVCPDAGGEIRPADESAAATPRTHRDGPKYEVSCRRALSPDLSLSTSTPFITRQRGGSAPKLADGLA